MKKQLFPTAAFCLMMLAAAAFGQDETRAVQTWKVQKYDISATLPQDDRNRSLGAVAILSLKNVSGRPASSLTLRISTLAEIASIKVNDAVTDFTKSEEKVGAAGSLQRLVLRIPAVAPDGAITATVDYKLSVKDNGGLASMSPIGSHFLPLSFWYPTPTSWFFNRGSDNGAVRVRVNGNAAQTVAASGTESGGAFEQKLNGQPFFVTGNWDTVQANGISVFMPKGIGPDGQKRSAELAALLSEARTFMAGILGTAPDTPLRIVAVRRGAGFAGGGTVLVDESVYRRPKIDSLTAMSIADAAAKIWIGGSVTVNGDGFGVIREGLPRFLAAQFLESKYGKDVADVERLRQRSAYATVSKRDVPMSQVSPLDDFYYQEVANKGAMAWRLIAKKTGNTSFGESLRANIQDADLTLAEVRAAFSTQSELINYLFDQTTGMNLLVGLPQAAAGEAKVALRNTGAIDATVTVTAFTANGQPLEAPATIRAQSFGEVVFKTANKITRVEVDTEKLYPQIEYSDDIAPRETTDSDPLLAVKRNFDKQDFAAAERSARTILASIPRQDDVRVLLGRSLLALGRTAEAETEFRAILDEKLPTSRSMAWANVGLADAAAKAGRNQDALKFAEAAIMADAEYGASLAARNIRNRIGAVTSGDPAIKAFFAEFDRAAVSNRKADVDALVMPGEASKFAGGLSGSTEQWQTEVRQIDRLDPNTVLVESNVTVKLLTKDVENGLAVYRLVKSGSNWRIAGVEMFEVR